ncbi:hypothetical protein Pelo_890 [Pelomyxa schiedti]|nr:hypothetical protein Pelo_890 [Pelomyxa schiedti]
MGKDHHKEPSKSEKGDATTGEAPADGSVTSRVKGFVSPAVNRVRAPSAKVAAKITLGAIIIGVSFALPILAAIALAAPGMDKVTDKAAALPRQFHIVATSVARVSASRLDAISVAENTWDGIVPLASSEGVLEGDNNDKAFMAIQVLHTFEPTTLHRHKALVELVTTQWLSSANPKLMWYGLKTQAIAKVSVPAGMKESLMKLYEPEIGGFASALGTKLVPELDASYFAMKCLEVLGLPEDFNHTKFEEFVLSTKDAHFAAFHNTPTTDLEASGCIGCTLENIFHAVELLSKSKTSNVTAVLEKVGRFLHYLQGPDGGFNTELPHIMQQYLHSPSTAAATAMALEVSKILYEANYGWLSLSARSRAHAYLDACAVHGLAAAPWGEPGIESTFWMMTYDKTFGFVAGLAPWISQSVFSVGLFVLVLACISWLEENLSAVGLVKHGHKLFIMLSICAFILAVWPQAALLSYICVWTWLSLRVYQLLKDDFDGIMLLVAMCNTIANLGLMIIFQGIAPHAFSQPTIFYVLLLWGILCTATVTFASGYFVPRHKDPQRWYMRASVVAWILSVPFGSVILLHLSSGPDIYRLVVLRGAFLSVFIVLPYLTYCLAHVVAVAAYRLYSPEGVITMKDVIKAKQKKQHRH